MVIQTSRFGSIEIGEDDVLTFAEGLLGFGNLKKFVLVDDPTDEIFAWLQSCELKEVAFPLLEPELFSEEYKIRLAKSDMEALGLKLDQKARFFNVITIPEDPTQMTANLKAPIVINVSDKKARQCVLQENDLAIREPIFMKLQQRLIQIPPRPIKSQAHDWGVAVRLNAPASPELNR